MKRRISLHGALRDADSRGYVELDVADGCDIARLREQLLIHLREHAPSISEGLVRRCAFATSESILHDHHAVPDDGELAVLPPVSGG